MFSRAERGEEKIIDKSEEKKKSLVGKKGITVNIYISLKFNLFVK